jgi:hypothetical protein
MPGIIPILGIVLDMLKYEYSSKVQKAIPRTVKILLKLNQSF